MKDMVYNSPSMGRIELFPNKLGHDFRTPEELEAACAKWANDGARWKSLLLAPEAFAAIAGCLSAIATFGTFKQVQAERDDWKRRAEAAEAKLAPERPRVACECGEADGHTGDHVAAACYRVTRANGQTLNVCGSCTLSGDTNRVWLDDEWEAQQKARDILACDRDEWKRRAEAEREKWQGALLEQQRRAEAAEGALADIPRRNAEQAMANLDKARGLAAWLPDAAVEPIIYGVDRTPERARESGPGIAATKPDNEQWGPSDEDRLADDVD